LIYICFIYEYI